MNWAELLYQRHRTKGPPLVGDHDGRRVPLSFHKLSNKAFGSLGIAAALHQNVENKTVLTDGTPKPVLLAANGDDDLTQAPFVAELAGVSSPDIIGAMPAEFLRPEAHGLVLSMIPRAPIDLRPCEG